MSRLKILAAAAALAALVVTGVVANGAPDPCASCHSYVVTGGTTSP